MNLRLPKFANVQGPRGLQARAVVFTAALMALTAAVSAAIVIFGAQTEGERLARAILESAGLAPDFAVVVQRFPEQSAGPRGAS